MPGLSGGFSFEKHFLSRDILQIRDKCWSLTSAPHGCSPSFFLTVRERGGGVLREVDLRMQTLWLDCVYITLRSDHNASSTTSGAGHADRITFRSEARLHLSFQCMWTTSGCRSHVNAKCKCSQRVQGKQTVLKMVGEE